MSRGARAGSGKSKKRRWNRLRWWLAVPFVTIAGILLLIAALCLVYRIPAVHPLSTLMISEQLTGGDFKRVWVPLDDISPNLVHSVLASEDAKFCTHHGIDWAALNAVIDDALDGDKPRGASTITMQTVKNLFLWPQRSLLRKALEAPLALYLDAVLTKRRVLEIYLNIVEWGPGIYGAQVASRHYFGRDASRLTPIQASLLAVTLPNPLRRNPASPSQGLRKLAALNTRRARQTIAYSDCILTITP